MDGIFASVPWQFAVVYMDDIVVFSKLPKNHIEQGRCVLRKLYKAGVTLKLKKGKFFTETIDYLGHVIRPGSVELAGHITDTVEKLEHSHHANETTLIPGFK